MLLPLPGSPVTGAAAESLLEDLMCQELPSGSWLWSLWDLEGFPGIHFSAGLWKRKVHWSLLAWGVLLSAVIKEAMLLEIVHFFITSLLRTPALRYFELNSWVLKILITVIYWRTLQRVSFLWNAHVLGNGESNTVSYGCNSMGSVRVLRKSLQHIVFLTLIADSVAGFSYVFVAEANCFASISTTAEEAVITSV